jgi:D-alanine-D-alanine ligase
MEKVGLFFGGISNESTVSIDSAKNIIANFDYKKHKIKLIYWHQNGYFYLLKNINELKKIKNIKPLSIESLSKIIDIAFPITHGKYGEDGILQAILESQKIKYCGCRVLSSAICMDKAIFKTLLNSHGIKQVKFFVLDYKKDNDKILKEKILKLKKDLKLPLFVKPANSGSSIGVNIVKKFSDLNKTIKNALKHDDKIIIEEGLIGHRELEIAVLGNKSLIVSDPGELKPANEFYDFVDKYELNKTIITVPARLSINLKNKIKQSAEKIYRLGDCSGFARIDFFLKNNQIYVNEINTLPGFTNISMFPRLMMKKGFSYRALINRIIELAY